MNRTVFLSVQDMEALASLLHGAQSKVEPLKADAIIEEWRREWTKGLVPRVDEKGGPISNESFGRFLRGAISASFFGNTAGGVSGAEYEEGLGGCEDGWV